MEGRARQAMVRALQGMPDRLVHSVAQNCHGDVRKYLRRLDLAVVGCVHGHEQCLALLLPHGRDHYLDEFLEHRHVHLPVLGEALEDGWVAVEGGVQQLADIGESRVGALCGERSDLGALLCTWKCTSGVLPRPGQLASDSHSATTAQVTHRPGTNGNCTACNRPQLRHCASHSEATRYRGSRHQRCEGQLGFGQPETTSGLDN
mmetsp:Transcript_20304/g.50759  ORF Transcript_20304/g.50759 Transcript_20304/m.50759 type:complete len:204 (+) Transcript_20304:320-931(+)